MKKTFLAALCLGLLVVIMTANVASAAKTDAEIRDQMLSLIPPDKISVLPQEILPTPPGVDSSAMLGAWIDNQGRWALLIAKVGNDLRIVCGWRTDTSGVREIHGIVTEKGNRVDWKSLKGRDNYIVLSDPNTIKLDAPTRHGSEYSWLERISGFEDLYPNFFGSATNATSK